jgi:hypothetical protein
MLFSNSTALTLMDAILMSAKIVLLAPLPDKPMVEDTEAVAMVAVVVTVEVDTVAVSEVDMVVDVEDMEAEDLVVVGTVEDTVEVDTPMVVMREEEEEARQLPFQLRQMSSRILQLRVVNHPPSFLFRMYTPLRGVDV